MSYKYSSGFVFGKFLPPHKGHLHLIDTALSLSEKVTLLVCSLKSEPINGSFRHKWLSEIYKDNNRIEVLHCDEELPQYPEEHSDFWNIWVDVAKRYCPSDIDCLFTSELYGEPYSNHLGILHHMVDLDRSNYPVSGTKVRSNSFDNWEFIPDIIKPYFVKRVAIMGPESVGKSTLTKKISNHFLTNFVPEYGRLVYEINNSIKLEDFIPISKERQELENWMIGFSNKIVICDTEDITTYIFSKMYFPNDYNKIEDYFLTILDEKDKYDLYILLKPDCDGVQDGTRNFLKERNSHYNEIKLELIKRKCNFVEVGGDWSNRYNECIKTINSNIFNI